MLYNAELSDYKAGKAVPIMHRFVKMPVAILSALFILSLAPALASEQTPRFLAHLLDYISRDYGGAVENGKVISASEYQEQVEFAQTSLELAGKLKETQSQTSLHDGIKKLQTAIAAKRPAPEVAALATSLKEQVIRAARLPVSPRTWPSLAKGEQIYRQNCVSCHGNAGRGDGPAAAGLEPPPVNFWDAERMQDISPLRIYNSIREGVPGTAMQPYTSVSDEDAWDMAFFVASIRHDSGGTPPSTPKSGAELVDAASLSDRELSAKLGESGMKEFRLYAAPQGPGASLAVGHRLLDEAVAAYRVGQTEEAKQKALAAYLDGVEPVELRIKSLDSALVGMIEEEMSAVRGAITAKEGAEEVTNLAAKAHESLHKADTLLSSGAVSPWMTFLIASGILLREGFEAVIVLIALLSTLKRSGATKATRWVHGGWIAALSLGVLAWFLSGWLMQISGASIEVMEGFTSLLAVAVLLYMGFWLHNASEISKWKSMIHGKVKTMMGAGNLAGLAALSFIAVFREVFETVLFLRALWIEGGSSSKAAMALGVFGSLALVMVITVFLIRQSVKLPIQRVFQFSAAMMALLAVILTGKGLHALQVSGWLPVHGAHLGWHSDLLGLYPTWQTMSAQLLVLTLIFLAWNAGKKTKLRSS